MIKFVSPNPYCMGMRVGKPFSFSLTKDMQRKYSGITENGTIYNDPTSSPSLSKQQTIFNTNRFFGYPRLDPRVNPMSKVSMRAPWHLS